MLDIHIFIVACRITSDGDVVADALIRQFGIGCRPHRAHARSRRKRLSYPSVYLGIFDACMPRQRGVDPKGNQMICGKTYVERLQIAESANKQASPY